MTLSPVTTTPGDEAGRELLTVHSSFHGEQDPDNFYQQMIANKRLVIRLHVEHLCGIAAAGGRRPEPRH